MLRFCFLIFKLYPIKNFILLKFICFSTCPLFCISIVLIRMQTNQMKAWDLSFKAPRNEINAYLKLWNMAAAISEHKMMRLVLHVKKTNLQIKNQPLGWECFQTWAISLQLFGNRKVHFRNKLRREKCSFQAHKGLFKTASSRDRAPRNTNLHSQPWCPPPSPGLSSHQPLPLRVLVSHCVSLSSSTSLPSPPSFDIPQILSFSFPLFLCDTVSLLSSISSKIVLCLSPNPS